MIFNRMKFRSQTPQYGQMKSRDGKTQRRKEKRRRKKIKEDKVRRKEIQVLEKVGKPQNIVISTDLWLRWVQK